MNIQKITTADGTVFIATSVVKMDKVKVTKNLDNNLVVKNNLEFLEGEKSKLETESQNLTQENKEIEKSIKTSKPIRIGGAIVIFVATLFAVELSPELNGIMRALISLAAPGVFYGLAEAYVKLQEKIMSNNCNIIRRNDTAISFLDKDIEKEKSKLKGDITYLNPTFKIEEIDDTEVRNYQERYDALLNVDNPNVEVVEAEEPKKAPILARPFIRK